MALIKGTNSYVSLVEAEAYFVDRLDIAAWTSANDTSKSQALVTATRSIDGLNWTGIAISDSQSLAFPRTGSYFEPRLGYYTELPSDIPTRIANATCELAYHLLNNDGLLDDTGVVTDLQISTISLNIKSMPSKMPSIVLNLVKPILLNGGSNLWWMAN